MVLCTQTDVEQRLQIDFTSDSDPVAASLIAAATGHMNRFAGFTLESTVYTTIDFDPPRGASLLLPERPLTAVATVTEDGTALTVADDYVFYDWGNILRVANGHPRHWTTIKAQSISVTYTAGWVTVPDDLIDVCARAAARAFQQGAAYAVTPAEAGAVTSISLEGSDSVSFSDQANDVTAAVSLTEDEIRIVRGYGTPPIV